MNSVDLVEDGVCVGGSLWCVSRKDELFLRLQDSCESGTRWFVDLQNLIGGTNAI